MAYGIYIQAMMLTLPWDRLHEAKAGQVPPSRGGGGFPSSPGVLLLGTGLQKSQAQG